MIHNVSMAIDNHRHTGEIMRRMRTLFALTMVGVITAITGTAAPAQADWPKRVFFVDGGYGFSSGTATFYNRSVEIQGNIDDGSNVGSHTQIRFDFMLDADTVYASQTRTAHDGERKSYHFTQEGPRGGIQWVFIRVCSLSPTSCASSSVHKHF
jgi:hypothetical protein